MRTAFIESNEMHLLIHTKKKGKAATFRQRGEWRCLCLPTVIGIFQRPLALTNLHAQQRK
jgi:hypothetical protein